MLSVILLTVKRCYTELELQLGSWGVHHHHHGTFYFFSTCKLNFNSEIDFQVKFSAKSTRMTVGFSLKRYRFDLNWLKMF